MVIALRDPEATMVEEDVEVKLETLAVDPLEVFPAIEVAEDLIAATSAACGVSMPIIVFSWLSICARSASILASTLTFSSPAALTFSGTLVTPSTPTATSESPPTPALVALQIFQSCSDSVVAHQLAKLAVELLLGTLMALNNYLS
jgi:hypothetical protein